MAEFVESLVLIGFGFALGFFADLLRDVFRRRARRKKVATMLGAEVKVIEQQAQESFDGLKTRLAQVENQRKNHTAAWTRVTDADFPSNVYHSVITDVALLDPELAVQVMELYRWIDYAHHRKQENVKEIEEVQLALARVGGDNPDPHDIDLLRLHAGYAVHFATVYSKIVAHVLSLARTVGKGLSLLAGRSFEYSVSIRLEEGPVVWQYPP